MLKSKDDPLKPRGIQGLKYLERLLPLLDELHEVGCQRDKAGNRSLHYDPYCLLELLFLFNPIVRTLRGLQQASTLKNVQRKLGCARASLGSLSEAVEVFDPERLCGIIETLAADVQPVPNTIGMSRSGPPSGPGPIAHSFRPPRREPITRGHQSSRSQLSRATAGGGLT
jgi:hypothetical protein